MDAEGVVARWDPVGAGARVVGADSREVLRGRVAIGSDRTLEGSGTGARRGRRKCATRRDEEGKKGVCGPPHFRALRSAMAASKSTPYTAEKLRVVADNISKQLGVEDSEGVLTDDAFALLAKAEKFPTHSTKNDKRFPNISQTGNCWCVPPPAPAPAPLDAVGQSARPARARRRRPRRRKARDAQG